MRDQESKGSAEFDRVLKRMMDLKALSNAEISERIKVANEERKKKKPSEERTADFPKDAGPNDAYRSGTLHQHRLRQATRPR